MNRRSLEFMSRAGLGAGMSLGLLFLLLWLPRTLGQSTVTPNMIAASDGPTAHAVELAEHTLRALDYPNHRDADIATVAVPIYENRTAQATGRNMQNWRAWRQLSPTIQAKVDSRILAELNGEVPPTHLGGDPVQDIIQPQKNTPLESTRFLIYLQDQPDLAQLEQLVYASQTEQRSALLHLLRSTAETQQAPLRALLDRRVQNELVGGYQPFYIVNAIAIEGGLDMVVELAQRVDVARLVANYPLLTVESPATTDSSVAAQHTSPEEGSVVDEAQLANWNIALVNADQVWRELGIRGEGAVVAGFDTGVNFRHPALVKQYRGNLGNDRFDHNYNWFEPDGKLYANGDLGPSVSTEPEICSNHGTHTMGTMVGDGGTIDRQVGLAPAATWIALPGICRNTMGGGLRDDIGGLKAFQWVLCPTDLTGELASADCSKAPDAVNNSWGSANPVTDLFRPIIRTLRAANIAPVFAAGNPYAGAGSIGTPANAPEAITVGATDQSDTVAYFSGRGPSFYPGEQKPELSAPGVSVNSTVGSSDYDTASGTSMAAPHVAGLIALMVSADLMDGIRDFTIDEIEDFMIRTSVDLGKAGPDDDYGYGRINAYGAVKAVLEAGDLRGTVRDALSDLPLSDVQMTGHGGLATFQVETGTQGIYSLTVPAGFYDLLVTAWGYEERRFSGQFVVAGAQSIADFALQPLPTVTVAGTVTADATPVADALIFIEAAPTVRMSTDANGNYSLQLPVGTHTLVVQKSGYQIKTQTLTLSARGPLAGDIALESAPSILLIEADAYRGWFDGWPIDLFFRSALDASAYLYDQWPIQYLDEEDTFEREDGSIGYGLPSLATLNQYDVVIWIQTGCSSGSFGCYFSNGPAAIGADETLTAYMDGGGRIIFSGQDLGFWEDGGNLFTNYLHTSLLSNDAAGEGDSLTGLGFLEGTQITITNASLYGHSNGLITLAPDAIAADRPLQQDAVNDTDAFSIDLFPILLYDDSQLPAAIAVDSCAAGYRAVYFGVGYENIAPRADHREPAIAATLGKSVEWVNGQRVDFALDLVATEPVGFAPPATELVHELRLVNSGHLPLAVSVTHDGAQWPIEIYAGTEEAVGTLSLLPCQSLVLDLRVIIPADAIDGARDQFSITVTADPSAGGRSGNGDGSGDDSGPLISRTIGLTSVAFVTWQQEQTMPTARHQLGIAALSTTNNPAAPTMLYAIGGWHNIIPGDQPTPEMAATQNTRFNSCTNEWEPLADLPEPRAGMAVATVGGQIYAIGGGSLLAYSSFSRVETHADVWRYDPVTNTWTELTPLPIKLIGAAATTLNGKIYVFGGMTVGYALEDPSLSAPIENVINKSTYIYDPATNGWSTGATIPGEGRFFAAAVPVGQELLLAGGWPNLDLVHLYNPITDRWRAGTPLLQGRHSFGLVIPDGASGMVYAIGGGREREGIGTVERFDPSHNVWEAFPKLLDDGRYGVAAGYAGGRIFAMGGADVIEGSESLAVGDSFCRSTYHAERNAVGIDEPIYYSVQLQGDITALPLANFQHRLPTNIRFVDFRANALGATYDDTTHTVSWQGFLPAKSMPAPVLYEVMADESLVHATSNAWAASDQAVEPGTLISSSVLFDDGNGLTFTHSAMVLMLATDIEGSRKEVARQIIRSGDQLTYTITILGNNFINRDVTLRDPLPATITYVPDSLQYSSGSGRYNAATHTIEWAGSTTQPESAFINLTDEYQWGDSDGRGVVGEIPYRWTDIAATGIAIGGGDYGYFCDLPIGFPFPFYGQEESTFCASANGFISFDPLGNSGDYYNFCPLPFSDGIQSMIAVVWDDLVIEDSIYYKAMGTAPNRYLVVQWSGARRYFSFGAELATFQAILFENGIVQLLIHESGELTGRSSTTGLEDQLEANGVTYACDEPGALHDKQAILFIPPNTTVGLAEAEIQFQATAGTGLEGNPAAELVTTAFGVNVPVTNTVYITLAQNQIARDAATLLNPLDLSDSTFTSGQAEVAPNDVAEYTMIIRNDGLVNADQATLTVALPTAVAYETGTLACGGGICQQQGNGTLQWTGSIEPQLPLTITFAARLTEGLRDRTLLTTTATLDDGFGTTYTYVVKLLARRSELSQSQLVFLPRFGEPGQEVVVMALLQNVGGLATNGVVTITVPSALHYIEGSLACGTGTCTLTESDPTNIIHWQGRLGSRELVPVRLLVQIPPDTNYGDVFTAALTVNDVDWGDTFTYEATVAAMHTILFPLIAGEIQQTFLYLPLVLND